MLDHPHARGENDGIRCSPWYLAGPSPRTWGERLDVARESHLIRTIPTHVGRTSWPAATALRIADHPHARGENGNVAKCAPRNGGPSPRTWGEPRLSCSFGLGLRTIPTHVGRTRSRSTQTPWLADHPHARGENGRRRRRADEVCGPSPRTWGERSGTLGSNTGHRTIPTHVGRTRL